MKLFCNADPRALGIENNEGDWDMGAFAAHIKKCEQCRVGLSALTGLPTATCPKCGHTWHIRKIPAMVCPNCHKILRPE